MRARGTIGVGQKTIADHTGLVLQAGKVASC